MVANGSIPGDRVEDLSGSPATLLRALQSEGVDPKCFVQELAPRFGVVWRDIMRGYMGLFCSVIAAGELAKFSPFLSIIAMLLGGISVGFCMAYLQLFMHEAAHHNIAKTTTLNDLLANSLLTIWVGQDIANYRRVHFAHHQHLGGVDDPERSYFEQPGWRLFLRTLCLVHLWHVSRIHSATAKQSPAARKRSLRQFSLGVILNAVVVFAAWWIYGWPAAGAWILGVLCFFPVFGTWRQVLEHRKPDADELTDYSRTPHGAYTRFFGTSLAPALFGGAGFNRHLLHHWIPQVSYTRFDELERILEIAPTARSIMTARRSRYNDVLIRLWKGASMGSSRS